MSAMPMLSVLIPVFNEKENLRPLLEELEGVLRAMGRPFEVIAVDDGSRDGSRELLRARCLEKPYLKAVFFRRNCGQSAAFDAGFRHASGDILITLDADLQNDPKDIPALLEKLSEGFDVVTGWRRQRKDGALLRKLPSRVANALIRAVTGTKVHDLGCSLKVYRREITSELRLYGEMHRFLIVLAEFQGARVAELEVNHRARAAGESKYGLSRTLKVLLDLLTVWFLRKFQTKPLYAFGAVGLAMLFGAFASSAAVLYEKFAQGVWVHRNPLFLISMMLALIGVQFLALGLLAEILVRTYFESQQKAAYPVSEMLGFSRSQAGAIHVRTNETDST